VLSGGGRAISGATRVAGVIGDPVEHSLSPVLHNAAFAALGIDWVYAAFRVGAGQGAAAVEAMRTLDLAGLSVTMPHKQEVAAAVDRLTPGAAALDAVNTVSWSRTTADSELVGESTDGPGFIAALSGDEGFDPSGRSCVVLGTGGAARAVVLALAGAGAAEVTVLGRRAEATARAAGLAGEAGRPVVASDGDGQVVRDPVLRADLIVNATPVGMGGEDRPPFGLEPAWLGRTLFVVDLVYSPTTTPLMLAARTAGVPCTGGLGMLIHQAARQVELWTGRPAPLEAMSAAVVAHLIR
jgi:shikimate dehydrogenase